MPDIYGIKSFIIRGILPEMPIDRTINYRPDQLENQTFSSFETRSEFDFIDGSFDDGDLRDSETQEIESIQSTTEGTGVIVDGFYHYAQSLWITNGTYNFSDGHSLSMCEDVRLIVLSRAEPDRLTGDVIANPIDETRAEITAYLHEHPGVKLTSFTLGPIRLEGPLNNTTICWQDDSFPICFAAGTILDTADGLRAVQDLRIGDLLLTFDNGYQPIRWIGSRSISGSELEANPKLRPVTIQTGALGDNRPSMPLTLSPQHRVMLRSPQAIELFGTDEILVPVKKLTELPGIDHADLTEVTYYHVLLDEHEILWSNGCLSESLYLGSQALQAITQEGRDEITAIFPGIADGNFQAAPARPFAERKKHIRHILTG